MLPFQEQDREVEIPISSQRRALKNRRAKFEGGFRNVTDKVLPNLFIELGPTSLAVPVSDELLCGLAIGSSQNSAADFSRESPDLRECLVSPGTSCPEDVESYRFVQNEARNSAGAFAVLLSTRRHHHRNGQPDAPARRCNL